MCCSFSSCCLWQWSVQLRRLVQSSTQRSSWAPHSWKSSLRKLLVSSVTFSGCVGVIGWQRDLWERWCQQFSPAPDDWLRNWARFPENNFPYSSALSFCISALIVSFSRLITALTHPSCVFELEPIETHSLTVWECWIRVIHPNLHFLGSETLCRLCKTIVHPE